MFNILKKKNQIKQYLSFTIPYHYGDSVPSFGQFYDKTPQNKIKQNKKKNKATTTAIILCTIEG